MDHIFTDEYIRQKNKINKHKLKEYVQQFICPLKDKTNRYLKNIERDNIKYVDRINKFSYNNCRIFKIYYINWKRFDF